MFSSFWFIFPDFVVLLSVFRYCQRVIMPSTCVTSLLIRIFLTILLISRLFTNVHCQDHAQLAQGSITYTRTELLSYRPVQAPGSKPRDFADFPREILPRKRGKKGGVRQRVRKRGFKPPLPSIVFGIVRSLPNKIDELRANIRFLHEYRESCLLCFTETWLHENIPDSAIDIGDYEIIRGDRTSESGKSRGGGVCVFVNHKWCNNWTVREKVCTPDYELLVVGLRPFYLPREIHSATC